MRYGGNTACVTVEAGGDLFIFDAGSGIRLLGVHLLQQQLLPIKAHLLLTHTHWDHIQGFPFFVPAFIPGNELNIYGPSGTDVGLADALSGQMLHVYFPVRLDQLGAALHFHHVPAGDGELHIGAARVLAAPLCHTGPTIGYRLEIAGRSIAYVTDTEPLRDDAGALRLDPAALRLAQDVDILIHDAQYTDAEYPSKVGWGHSPLSYVLRLAVEARAKRLVLFHHDPLRTDDQLETMVAELRQHAGQTAPTVTVDAAAEGVALHLPPLVDTGRAVSSGLIAAG